jgi:hypothetical protein
VCERIVRRGCGGGEREGECVCEDLRRPHPSLHQPPSFTPPSPLIHLLLQDGIDYKKLRELQTKGIRDIARDWVTSKRERKSTTQMVRGETHCL